MSRRDIIGLMSVFYDSWLTSYIIMFITKLCVDHQLTKNGPTPSKKA